MICEKLDILIFLLSNIGELKSYKVETRVKVAKKILGILSAAKSPT